MSLSITSSYSGEFAGKYVSAALLSGNTIANNLIEVKPNVKFKEVLKRVNLSGAIANASCDFTDAGAVALTEKIIEPKELQVNLELCKTPFQSDWEAISMGVSSHDNLPSNFSDVKTVGVLAARNVIADITIPWGGTISFSKSV